MNEQVRLRVRRNNPAGRIPRPPPNSPVQRHPNQLQNIAGRQVQNNNVHESNNRRLPQNNVQEPNNRRRPQVNSAEAPTPQNTRRLLNQNNGNIIARDFGAIGRRRIQPDDVPGPGTPQAQPRNGLIPQIMINGQHLQQENGLAQEQLDLGTHNAPPSDADNGDVAADASVQSQQQNRQAVHEEMVPTNRPQPSAATEPQNRQDGPPDPEPQNRLQDPDPEPQNRLQDPDLEPQNRLQDPDLEPQNRLQDPDPEPQNRLQNSNPEPQNRQQWTVYRNRPADPVPQSRPPRAVVPRPPSRQLGMIRQTPSGQQTAQYGPVLGPQNRPRSVRIRPVGNESRAGVAVVQNINLATVPVLQRYRPQDGAETRRPLRAARGAQAGSASEGATRGNERVGRARGRHRISLESRPRWRY